MKDAVAPVKNVVNLAHCYQTVASRSRGVPGILLVEGETGAGKTTAVEHLAGKTSAVWVRATAVWTPRSMLHKISAELGGSGFTSSADMVDWIAAKLKETERPVFVDEGDYLATDKRLVETLRDLHDMSSVPFIIIGMAGFRKEIIRRPHLAGRISQWIGFKPLDLDDARTMAATLLSGVELADDMLEYVHEKTRGSARGLVVAFSRIESKAAGRWPKVTRDLWQDRELTLSSGAP